MPGGTAEKLRKAVWPHLQEGVALAVALEFEGGVDGVGACRVPYSSTCTEWSMTSSAGCSGLIFFGIAAERFMASRIAARSTIAGTPVKSCIRTRAGM